MTQTDIALMIAEIKAAKKDWEEKQARLVQFNQELSSLTTQIQAQEEVLAGKRKQNLQADRQIEKGQQTLLALSESLKQAEGQKDVLLERTKHTQKVLQSIKPL